MVYKLVCWSTSCSRACAPLPKHIRVLSPSIYVSCHLQYKLWRLKYLCDSIRIVENLKTWNIIEFGKRTIVSRASAFRRPVFYSSHKNFGSAVLNLQRKLRCLEMANFREVFEGVGFLVGGMWFCLCPCQFGTDLTLAEYDWSPNDKILYREFRGF